MTKAMFVLLKDIEKRAGDVTRTDTNVFTEKDDTARLSTSIENSIVKPPEKSMEDEEAGIDPVAKSIEKVGMG